MLPRSFTDSRGFQCRSKKLEQSVSRESSRKRLPPTQTAVCHMREKLHKKQGIKYRVSKSAVPCLEYRRAFQLMTQEPRQEVGFVGWAGVWHQDEIAVQHWWKLSVMQRWRLDLDWRLEEVKEGDCSQFKERDRSPWVAAEEKQRERGNLAW